VEDWRRSHSPPSRRVERVQDGQRTDWRLTEHKPRAELLAISGTSTGILLSPSVCRADYNLPCTSGGTGTGGPNILSYEHAARRQDGIGEMISASRRWTGLRQ